MNETFVVRELYPVLPEIMLAVGAMVLLMVGAFRGERATTTVNWLAILLLVAAGASSPGCRRNGWKPSAAALCWNRMPAS